MPRSPLVLLVAGCLTLALTTAAQGAPPPPFTVEVRERFHRLVASFLAEGRVPAEPTAEEP